MIKGDQVWDFRFLAPTQKNYFCQTNPSPTAAPPTAPRASTTDRGATATKATDSPSHLLMKIALSFFSFKIKSHLCDTKTVCWGVCGWSSAHFHNKRRRSRKSHTFPDGFMPSTERWLCFWNSHWEHLKGRAIKWWHFTLDITRNIKPISYRSNT